MSKFLRAIRGATTLVEDSKEEVLFKTQELLLEVLKRNSLSEDDIVSIIFTTTNDITSAFPAAAVREIGFQDTPLLGASEQNVRGSTPLCIRLLINCYSEASKAEITHIYLHDAVALRPDIAS